MVSASGKKAPTRRSFARAVHDCTFAKLHEDYLAARCAEGLRDWSEPLM